MTQVKPFFSAMFAIVFAVGSAPDTVRGSAALSKSLRSEPLIRFQFAPGDLTQECAGAIETLKQGLSAPTDAFVFEKELGDFSDKVYPLTFMGYVSTDATIREEASDCEVKMGEAYTDTFTRRDLYQVVKNTKPQNAAEERLILQHARSFEKNGMALSDDQLNLFREKKKKLAFLESEFSKNLNEDKTRIELSREELDGVREDFISAHATTPEGKFIITTKSTDYTEVMDNAKNSGTRKKMLFAYEHRAAIANTKLLNEAVTLRAEIAKLLGFETWADYRIQGRMAPSSQAVRDLLEDLKTKLKPRLEKDFGLLLKAKREMEDPNAMELIASDIRYFSNQVKKKDFSVDESVVREYFPKDIVMKGMFEVYSTLLGVTYKEVGDAEVWSPDVKLYEIHDKNTDEIIGHFYTDFVPRDGKYGHAAAFPLISGRATAVGGYTKPVAGIVANFTPPANGKPSLLTHNEVETLFHEFGHIMHQTLTRAPYASLSGSNTAQDFVEAPSQMLENWVWSPQILEMISGHYMDPTKKLPRELVEKMVAAADFNTGYLYSRQLTFGLTDMKIHSTNEIDVNEAYRQTHFDVMGVPTVEDSNFMASFGHMMGGYDAGYYGYIWSEVYAQDMFTLFEQNGLLDSATGEKYRTVILEKGDMTDAYELLKEFLDREPNMKAFLKKLGIE